MGPLETRRALRTTVIGLVGIVVWAFVLYIMSTAHTGLPFVDRTTVRAAFDNTDALKPGDDVRQSSITIGRVEEIEFSDGKSIVTMAIDGDKPFYADATAKMWDFSTLGAKFVEIDPGTPASGPLGDRPIPAEQTQDSADLHDFYGVFDEPTRNAAASAAREFGGGAAGHGADLQDLTRSSAGLLTNNGTVSEALASDEADLPALLRAAQSLSERFVGREARITEAVEQTDVTFRAFTVEEGRPLGATLDELPATLDSMRTAFDALDQPLRDTQAGFAEFERGATALGEATPEFRGFLRDAVGPFEKTPDVMDDLAPALGDFEETFADGRPLAPRLNRFFTDLGVPTGVLSPYSEDIANLFVRGDSLESRNTNGLQYAQIYTVGGARTALGGVEGIQSQDHYPKPGDTDRNGDGTQSLPPIGETR